MALNVSVIISAIDRLSGPVKGMSDRMQAFRQAGAWMTGAGAAINGTLLAAAKSAETLGSQLNDMSVRTGVSGTALSELKYAAEQTGSSLEGVEKALRFVARNAYDASTGGSETAEAFAALSVKVTDASGKLKQADVLMNEVSTALRGVQSDSERSALAMEIFGRSGAAMLPMIMDAKGGIAGLREEARKLGLSLSEEDIAAADDFGDSMGRMSDTAGMAFNRIGFIIIPTLTAITERIVTATAWFSRFSQEHPKLARGMVFAAAGAGLLLAILGPILYLLPGLVNGWKLVSGALTLTSIAARLAKAELFVAGLTARASGIYAIFAAGGFKALGASALAAGAKMLAVAWPVLVAVAAVLTLIGAIQRMIQLFDDVKNHKWADALKHSAEGLIPGDFIFRGGEQVLNWAKSAAGKFSNPLKALETSGVDIPTMEDAQKQLASLDLAAANVQLPQIDAAGADLKLAADKQTASADALKSAADSLGSPQQAATPQATAPAATQQDGPRFIGYQKRTDSEGTVHWDAIFDKLAARAQAIQARVAAANENTRRAVATTRAGNGQGISAITVAPGFSAGKGVGQDTPEQAVQRAYARYDQPGATPPIVPTGKPNEYMDLRRGPDNQGKMTLTPEQAVAILRQQPQYAGGDTYSTTINVPINVPPGSNVDTKQLARDVAEQVEKRQRAGYMNQHRRAAAKLQAVPTG